MLLFAQSNRCSHIRRVYNMINMKLKHSPMFELFALVLLFSRLGCGADFIHFGACRTKTQLLIFSKDGGKILKERDWEWERESRCVEVRERVAYFVFWQKKNIQFFVPHYTSWLTTWATYETYPLLILCVKGSIFVDSARECECLSTRTHISSLAHFKRRRKNK